MGKKQKSHLVNWSSFIFNETKIDDKDYLTKVCYMFDKDFCIDKILFTVSKNTHHTTDISNIIDMVKQICIPEFSIKGKDLINEGLTDYGKIKDILEKIEKDWIDNNFQDTMENLLQKAKALF